MKTKEEQERVFEKKYIQPFSCYGVAFYDNLTIQAKDSLLEPSFGTGKFIVTYVSL